ncbi:hypothetical protein MSG28_004097 [Choristoneura fumiferana]|nr:hypothetical protein MSG28_004097 [Choristoneura fumiferana]
MVMHDFALIIHQMTRRRLVRLTGTDGRGHNNRIKLNISYLQKPNEVIEARARKAIKCQQCDLAFGTKDLLIEHRLQQNCVCPPCPQCGKLVSNLARHKKNVHLRTDEFTCHICGKEHCGTTCESNTPLSNLPTVLSLLILNDILLICQDCSDRLIHSDKCDYSCPLCPYKGKQQSYLTLHMRVHTGERPYLCSFVNPSNLRKHQLTHSRKKFECNKCKKQFRLLETLQEHYEAAHLNVRYRCSICGRDLWSRCKLLSHELRVHNREKHKLYDEIYKVVLNDEND